MHTNTRTHIAPRKLAVPAMLQHAHTCKEDHTLAYTHTCAHMQTSLQTGTCTQVRADTIKLPGHHLVISNVSVNMLLTSPHLTFPTTSNNHNKTHEFTSITDKKSMQNMAVLSTSPSELYKLASFLPCLRLTPASASFLSHFFYFKAASTMKLSPL